VAFEETTFVLTSQELQQLDHNFGRGMQQESGVMTDHSCAEQVYSAEANRPHHSPEIGPT
jgi:hypothetical protein